MSSGYVQKYVIYAIGEIVLVVIGILLALQINNWNENRKAQIVEMGYLQALEKEFVYNQETLDHFINLNEKLIQQAIELLEAYR